MQRPMFISTFIFGIAVLASGCGDGGSGTTGLDCGDNGTEHEGHCHCDSGYLFDGTTCVDPEEITTVCEEHTDTDDHVHGACACPASGVCPCDDGTIETYGGVDYCVPDLHAE